MDKDYWTSRRYMVEDILFAYEHVLFSILLHSVEIITDNSEIIGDK